MNVKAFNVKAFNVASKCVDHVFFWLARSLPVLRTYVARISPLVCGIQIVVSTGAQNLPVTSTPFCGAAMYVPQTRGIDVARVANLPPTG